MKLSELYELNSILTGFTQGELFQIRTDYFQDGNFLSFVGNLHGWTTDQVNDFLHRNFLDNISKIFQLKMLAQLALGNEQRLTPSLLENGGQILCAIDDQLLRRIPPEEIK